LAAVSSRPAAIAAGKNRIRRRRTAAANIEHPLTGFPPL
jgi:hypothetical protein